MLLLLCLPLSGNFLRVGGHALPPPRAPWAPGRAREACLRCEFTCCCVLPLTCTPLPTHSTLPLTTTLPLLLTRGPCHITFRPILPIFPRRVIPFTFAHLASVALLATPLALALPCTLAPTRPTIPHCLRRRATLRVGNPGCEASPAHVGDAEELQHLMHGGGNHPPPLHAVPRIQFLRVEVRWWPAGPLTPPPARPEPWTGQETL